MSYYTLTSQKKNSILIINLLGPANDQVELARLHDELAELYDEIVWDEGIKVIILTGTGGKSFSMGASLEETISGLKGEHQRFLSLAEPISSLDRPVIAAINGDAIGLGLELALACDLRIAIETSHFGLTHIKSGLIPWDGGTQRLSRLVGWARAMEMILTGDMIDAQEAYRIGLVNRVVASEELMNVVLDMAKEMASRGPIALRYAKEAIWKGTDLTLEQGLRLEADLYLLLHTTRDRTEGIKMFRGKRSPHFEGR